VKTVECKRPVAQIPLPKDLSHVYPVTNGARFTPWGGFAGGIKERAGGSLERIASRSLERRDQAALCTPSAGFHCMDALEVFVVVVRWVISSVR